MGCPRALIAAGLAAAVLSTGMKPQETHINRLAKEKSPYLLQHAHNPVDWHPWGKEAFEKARREEKPIFLSVGYSTCHWCHVMERESFEDADTAALLNRHFVSIKVDREERPDVDALYMQAVMQMAGRGGWPMSVFLTPDLKPFYGGTYFPPEDAYGQPGFKSVLRSVAQAWAQKRDEVVQSAQAMTAALQGREGAPAASSALPLTAEILQQAFQIFAQSYDEEHGGFHPAPKFPRSHALSLLLWIWKRTGDEEALKMAEKTLQAMAAGGLADQIGGGFHRYSTDARWFLPHFEKMLYDQALLARTYLEAYQATGKEEYARTARAIFEYVLRDMTDPAGGFYSAEDADSEPRDSPAGDTLRSRVSPNRAVPKKEGAFYVWSAEDLEKALGAEEVEVFSYLYGVRARGNVQNDPMQELTGQNILHQARTVKEAAQKFQKPEREIEALVSRAKKSLFDLRILRPRPHLDDKILVDWNGLMIGSLAFGSRVLNEPRYADAAERAADFILQRMVRKDGRLLHRYRDGEAAIPAHLEGYAFLIHGLIGLYEATFGTQYLAEAKRLTEEMIRLFWDEKQGGFFLIGIDAEHLLVRQKEAYDGAVPSGNSVAALDLLRIGRFTGNRGWEERAGRILDLFSGSLHQNPSAYPQMLIALDFALGPSSEIVIAGPAGDPATDEMVRAVYARFLPNRVLVLHPPGEAGARVEKLVPFVREQGMLKGKPAAYVCRNYACQFPVTQVEELEKLLKN